MHQNLVNPEAFDNEISGSRFGQKVIPMLFGYIKVLVANPCDAQDN